MNDEPIRKPNSAFPSRGEALGVLLLTFFAFLAIGVIGEGSLGKAQILLGELFVVVPAYLFVRWRKYDVTTIFRIRPVGWRIVIASFMIGLSMTIVADELDRLMNLILPFPEELAEVLKQLLVARTFTDWAIIVLGAVLLAGLFEEMLFRGFLQNSLEQYGDVTRAVLWTALLFAAFHVNPWWLAQIILLGVILGVLAWKSDSIIPGAIVHAINNAISVALINVGEKKIEIIEWNGHIHPLLLLAAITALVLSLRLFYQYCDEETRMPTLLNTP